MRHHTLDFAKWTIGAEIYDMHYGSEIAETLEVQSHIRFRTDDEQKGNSFWNFLNGVRRSVNGFYTNKVLIIIGEPMDDDFWTVAYSYDGRRAGIMKVKPILPRYRLALYDNNKFKGWYMTDAGMFSMVDDYASVFTVHVEAEKILERINKEWDLRPGLTCQIVVD